MGKNKFNIGDEVDVTMKGVVKEIERKEAGDKEEIMYVVRTTTPVKEYFNSFAFVTEDKLCLLETPKDGQK